ncbi:hypothetical protein PENSUB_420 [Penicillium subrubescens]|uniref:Uncharacterized protein n=1 Tax=Penicillium subrubescens TaxID=1316194 RepID=A0A1Q5UMX6_9EURO|nr:hypothetical protein PENSUB_420 [Penicillium subrubescens]
MANESNKPLTYASSGVKVNLVKDDANFHQWKIVPHPMPGELLTGQSEPLEACHSGSLLYRP